MKVSSSEYMLLAVVSEVPGRTVTLPNLTIIQVVHVFVGFIQSAVDRFSTAVPKLSLIAYHLWALYFDRVPP